MGKTKNVQKKRISKRRYSKRKTSRKYSKKVYRNKRKQRRSNRTKKIMMGGMKSAQSPVRLEGHLHKASTQMWRAKASSWKRRYIVLSKDGILRYYDGNSSTRTEKGKFDLQHCTLATVGEDEPNEFKFKDTSRPGRQGWFKASSAALADKWINTINNTPRRYQTQITKPNPEWSDPAFLVHKHDAIFAQQGRLPEGTLVIVEDPPTQMERTIRDRKVVYTRVSYNGQFGYIATDNLPPPPALPPPEWRSDLASPEDSHHFGPAVTQPAPAPPPAPAAATPSASPSASPSQPTTSSAAPNVEFYSNVRSVQFTVGTQKTPPLTIDDFHSKYTRKYDFLEGSHDYIQWLFPLTTPSSYKTKAKPLTSEEIHVFNTDAGIKARLIKSFQMIADFYGFDCAANGTISSGRNFKERMTNTNTHPHNFWRISRILKCLHLMDLDDIRRNFRNALRDAIDGGELSNAKDQGLLKSQWALK